MFNVANPYIRRLAGLGDFFGDGFSGSDVAATDPGYYIDPAPVDPSASTPVDSGNWGNWSLDSIIGDITKIGTTAAQLYAQQQAIQINADRLKRGLPPVVAAQVAPQSSAALTPQNKQLLIYGGIALVAVLALAGGRR